MFLDTLSNKNISLSPNVSLSILSRFFSLYDMVKWNLVKRINLMRHMRWYHLMGPDPHMATVLSLL